MYLHLISNKDLNLYMNVLDELCSKLLKSLNKSIPRFVLIMVFKLLITCLVNIKQPVLYH